MRVTGIFSLAGALVFGIIIADFLTHPQGTTVLANAGTEVEKVSVNGLLGKTS
jgi:hypothetical protein